MKKCYVKFDVKSIFSKVFFTFAILVSVMTMPMAVMAQTSVVKGSVRDEKGQPMIGVTVVVKGTTTGVVTDLKGIYNLPKVAKNATLLFTSVGYEPIEVVVGAKSMIDVVMKELTMAMDEVVVVGYGTMKKKDLTGAIASIDGAKIVSRQTTDVSQALQGAMPGVTVTRSSSAPGGSASIRVRGITSIKESSPLIIIDGVPGSLEDVNPQDIENISVLKDAASASIYGARAAAGVVLVTTRRAKGEGASVSYSYSLSLDIPTAMPEFTDAIGYMKAQNELARNDNSSEGDYAIHAKDLVDNWRQLHATNPDLYPDTDWVAMCMDKVAPRHSHQFTISSGGAKRKTNISIGYDDVQGLFKKNLSWERFTVRANNDINVNKWLSTSLDVNFKKTKAVNPYFSPSGNMRYAAPIYAAEWEDGRVASGKTGNNPYGKMMYGGTKKTDAYEVGGKVSIDITPIKDLKISGVFSPRFNFSKNKDFNIAVPYTNFDTPGVNSGLFLDGANTTDLQEKRADSYGFTTQVFANYNKSFGKHNINAMVGFEEYHYFWEDLTATSLQFPLSEYPYISAGSSEYLTADNSSPKENGYRSLFARAMYNYDSRYYIQANVRYDGSSRFNKDYRWGTFPSFSAGWVVSQEKFMKDVKAISFLKVRASWGQLGNERIGDYPYQSSLTFHSPVMYSGGGTEAKPVIGASASQFAIRDISWETTETYDIGLDINFFNNRLRLSGDYYKKSTSGMLLLVEIPNFLGYTNPYQNAGKMHTKGWDLELGWSDKAGDLNYSISVNLSDYKSIMGTLKGTEFSEGGTITTEGYEFQSWYGYISNGIYQNLDQLKDSPLTSNKVTVGDIGYKDVSGADGVPDGKITGDYDRVPLGGSLPRFNFGGSINLEYRGFDFNLVFQGVGKRTALLKDEMVQPIRADWYNVPLFVDKSHWSVYNTIDQNKEAKYPRYSKTSESNNYAVSDYWLINGAYMRIKNITVGYTLPQKWMNKISFSSARVYVSLNDFFTFSHFPKGWDPEVSSTGYPITKSVVIGASVRF